MLPRASRLCGVILEATLDTVGHAGLLTRLRHPGYVARLMALCGVPADGARTMLAPLVHRALKHDADRLDLVVYPDLLALRDGRFAPLRTLAPAVVGAPPPPLTRGASKVFARAAPRTDDARLSSAFDLAFLPLPAPFLDVARRPRTVARVTCALALCAEVIFSRLSPADPLANKRAARAFGSDDDTGLYVVVFDEALRQLEKMLHRTSDAVDRIAPLQSLAQILDDGAKAERGVAASALAKRDTQAARVYGYRELSETSGPTIFRRVRRRAQRRVDDFNPRRRDVGYDQGDLFAW